MNRRKFVVSGSVGLALTSIAAKPISPLPPPPPVPQMTTTLTPSGGDDTAQINAAINAGGEVVFTPGTYNVPNGIVESKPGLYVRGIGHRVQGPGDAGLTTGVILKSTNPAVWTWTRNNPTVGVNEYRGALIEGITFTGNGLGGLFVRSSYNTVRDCSAIGYTSAGATGFKFKRPDAPADSAQENFVIDCGAQNCMIGLESDCGDETEIRGFITLKTTFGGIHNQGYGVILRDASRLIGGKLEGNATGALVIGSFVELAGVGFEDNLNWDVDFDKGTTSQSFTSNVLVSSQAGKVRVGPWQFGDSFVGGNYPHLFTDVPNPQGIAKQTTRMGNGQMQVPHIGYQTPTGGNSGSVFMATGGNLWRNDGGVWSLK